MPRRLGVVIVALALLLVAGGAILLWPRDATPVSEADAIERYREASGDSTVPDEGAVPADDSTALPEPGVYRYTTSGAEDVKLGVLPTEHREYPETVNAIVVREGTDCFSFTLNLLEQHTEDTTYCRTADGGLRIDSHQKHQRIGALSPTATMSCDPDVLVGADDEGQELACTLELDGGPAKLDASLAGTSTVADDDVAVEGSDVPAIRIQVDYEISGDLSGTWQEQVWFAADDLTPLQITRTFDLAGLATFSEQSELVLASRSPTS